MSNETNLWVLCETLYFPRKITLRSDKTKVQYKYAIEGFSKHLGHVATTADLDDDLLTMWMAVLLDSGLAVDTVREKAGRIISLWNWLARRGVVRTFPTLTKPPAPEPRPIAPREDDLRRLFRSASKERGFILGIPADIWWMSLFAFVFCTSERKGAALAVKPEWIDLDNAIVQIPAAVRKGRRKNACYHLWPEVVPLLREVLRPSPNRELVWPWPWHEGTFYNRLGRICLDAGWPDDHKHKIHSLRVAHATYRHIAGGDATRQLMHGESATTEKHYIDKSLLPPDGIMLFVPWQPRAG